MHILTAAGGTDGDDRQAGPDGSAAPDDPVRKAKRRRSKMSHCEANHCIKCTVQQCVHHCTDQNYCALECVTIGTHEANPTMDQCTDCKSFERK